MTKASELACQRASLGHLTLSLRFWVTI